MNEKRITYIKKGSNNPNARYVVYWMQQSQRIEYNHALSHAIMIANQNQLPLLVIFALTPNYPDANARHYTFMLEGIQSLLPQFAKKGISFVFKIGKIPDVIFPFLENTHTLIVDVGYLRHQREWRKDIMTYCEKMALPLTITSVESDLIVPVSLASQKAEYGAYTLRSKLHQTYSEFRDHPILDELVNQSSIDIESDHDLMDISSLVKTLPINHLIVPSKYYHGGYDNAKKALIVFFDTNINSYPKSNDPSLNNTSKLSMYLHFGQISSLEILDHLIEAYHQKNVTQEAYLAFFEQLLVRRELAFNYVTYQEGYYQFKTMTEPWAYETMNQHESDIRPIQYTDEELINAKTHDRYFNAAMDEMTITGYMHNYMRMYWAKKIIEWSSSYQEAYERILRINNAYFIDGRDPNSYAGIAWCFGKHDRAWTERLIFGKLRYMNANGLIRKFDIEEYVQRINLIKESERDHE